MLKVYRLGTVLTLAVCLLAPWFRAAAFGGDEKESAAQPQPQSSDDKTAKFEKQMRLQQKQIETLEKMVELLTEQAKKKPAAPELDELAEKTTVLESRSLQAARRDQDLARAIDDIFERQDNQDRNGPQLPANLKQLFLPSQTNQTPLSIYGVLVTDFTKLGNQPPNFDAELDTFFLLNLNEHFFIESELDYSSNGVEFAQCQVDWILNDWATLVFGRFLTPIGFFNERLHPGWINKLPDAPLMFRQVSPSDFSQNGVQFRGATYLFGSPLKMEYSAFLSNGMGVAGAPPDFSAVANLQQLKETSQNINNSLAYGGRLGFWLPEYGLTWGISGLANGAYTETTSDDLTIWQLDAGWRSGNWEIRSEYAEMHQNAGTTPVGNDIRRRGLYAQLSYRPYDSCSAFWQKLEFIGRYSFANFRGINPALLDTSAFASTLDLPVNRNQYTFGVDYWLTPSAALKFAYQINEETGTKYRDNAYLAQFSVGF